MDDVLFMLGAVGFFVFAGAFALRLPPPGWRGAHDVRVHLGGVVAGLAIAYLFYVLVWPEKF